MKQLKILSYILASSCLSAGAWDVIPDKNGTTIEFADIVIGHPTPLLKSTT